MVMPEVGGLAGSRDGKEREMASFDDGAAIESGVDGAEAENLGFGAAGGCAVHVRTALAQCG